MRNSAFILFLFLFTATAGLGFAEEPKNAVVYLDPYYGGRDNGPVIDRKTRGKDVTLSLAKAIQKGLLEKNIKAYLSREDDVYIPRGDRWFFAKKKGADIYLSLRLLLTDRDCIRIYYPSGKGTNSRSISDIESTPPGRSAKNSRCLSELLQTNVKNNNPSLCTAVNPKKDVIFETADFPAVIIEFGLSRAGRSSGYILDPARVETIAKSIADACGQFIKEQYQ